MEDWVRKRNQTEDEEGRHLEWERKMRIFLKFYQFILKY